MQLHRLIISLATLVLSHLSLSAQAQAHDARIGSIHVIHPAAPATLPGQRSGAIYLSIENQGKTADRLVSLRSPVGSVAIHKMTMDGNIMKMREVDGLPLPPAARVVMKADGSHHLMLTGLQQPLAPGEEVPLTLTFERAGTVEVSVHVGQNAAQKTMEKMGH